MSDQPIENMNIEGFFPVIINVVPMPSLPVLLGLVKDEPQQDNKAEGRAKMSFGRTERIVLREREEVFL